MEVGDWVQLAGVVVALVLGVYNAIRSRIDRKEARRLLRWSDAHLVTFWGDYDNNRQPPVYRLSIRNDGPVPIVDAKFYFPVESFSFDGTYEGWSEGQTLGAVVQPGSVLSEDIEVSAVRHLDNPMRVSFIDGHGVSWYLYSNGTRREREIRSCHRGV